MLFSLGWSGRLLLLSILGIATAAPGPAALEPRSCSTGKATFLNQLTKARPDENHFDGTFRLSRTGGSNSNTIKTVVTFGYIPEDATGCQLRIDIPQVPTRYLPGPFANGTGTQSDVWLVKTPPVENRSRNFPYAYEWTWNQPPEKDQFVSTVFFPPGTPTDSSFQTNLWSGTCGGGARSFLFELSDWQQGGGDVDFFNTIGEKVNITPIGFRLIYNC